MAINPMKTFKSSLTKEYEIAGKKVLFRALDNSEIQEVELFVLQKSNGIDNSNIARNLRQLKTLSMAIVSIDEIPLSTFDDVKKDMVNNMTENEAIMKELNSWEPSILVIMYGYYLKFLNEKDQKYKKDFDFLSA